MKKILAFVAASLLATGVFAEGFAVGLRGGLNMNVGPVEEEYMGDKDGMYMGFGFGAVGTYDLSSVVSGLGLQAEIDFNLNGWKFEDGDLKYNTLDIPVMVTYTVPAGPLNIIPMAGFYLGIPIGKIKGDDISVDFDNSLLFGTLFGIEADYPVNDKFTIGADFRFSMDFSKIAADVGDGFTFDIGKRMNLGIGLIGKYKL